MKVIPGALLPLAILVAVSGLAQDGTEGEDASDIVSEAEEVVLDPNAPPSTEPGCFSIRRVRNFASLTDELLYVEQSGDSHFVLTMFGICRGLRNAQAIGIESHQDRVCSNSQAEVTFRGVGGRRDSCLIQNVEAVEDRDAARAIAEMRSQRQ